MNPHQKHKFKFKSEKKQQKQGRQEFRPAVFVVVYKKENSRISYLILKRKKHWTGYEFPKGGIEKNENIKVAVRRETYEETGLRPIHIKRFNFRGRYFYSQKFPDRPGAIGQAWELFACQVPEDMNVRLDEHEHSAFRWMNFEDALKKLTFKNQKMCLNIVNRYLTSSPLA